MKRLALHTFIVMATLVGIALLWQLRWPVTLFLMSLATAAMLRPLIERMTRRGLPHWLALFAAYVLGLGIPVSLLLAAATRSVIEVRSGSEDMALAYQRLEAALAEGNWLEQGIAVRLPHVDQLSSLVNLERSKQVLQATLGMTFNAFELCIDLVVVIAMSLYWTLDRAHFERLWLSLLSGKLRPMAREAGLQIEVEIGSYLRSELVQSMAAGVLLAVGYGLIGHRYPVLLATIGAAAWLVPWLGVVLSVIAAIALSLPAMFIEGGSAALLRQGLAVGYTLIVLLLLETLVEPRLFRRRRYSPLLMAFLAIALADVLGILGLILGPPLSVLIELVFGQVFRRGPSADLEGNLGVEMPARLSTLQGLLETTPDLSPELGNFVERLSKLFAEARPILRLEPEPDPALRATEGQPRD